MYFTLVDDLLAQPVSHDHHDALFVLLWFVTLLLCMTGALQADWSTNAPHWNSVRDAMDWSSTLHRLGWKSGPIDIDPPILV
jgi:hypothetical protein